MGTKSERSRTNPRARRRHRDAPGRRGPGGPGHFAASRRGSSAPTTRPPRSPRSTMVTISSRASTRWCSPHRRPPATYWTTTQVDRPAGPAAPPRCGRNDDDGSLVVTITRRETSRGAPRPGWSRTTASCSNLTVEVEGRRRGKIQRAVHSTRRSGRAACGRSRPARSRCAALVSLRGDGDHQAASSSISPHSAGRRAPAGRRLAVVRPVGPLAAGRVGEHTCRRSARSSPR